MKTLIASLLCLLTPFVGAGCVGQSNVSEKAHKSGMVTPAAVQAAQGRFSRIVVLRIKGGEDLLQGLQDGIKQEKIQNAVILAGIGSLTRHHIHVVSNTIFPPENRFVKEDGPSDLLNVNGYVIDGRVHAHITLSNDRTAIGGHLEPGTKVFTFAIVTLGVLDADVSLQRFDDWR